MTMNTNEEDMLYDIMYSISEYSAPLCKLINGLDDKGEKEIYSRAYRDGVYSVGIRLQLMLPDEAMERGKLRHEKMMAEIKACFANGRPNPEASAAAKPSDA